MFPDNGLNLTMVADFDPPPVFFILISIIKQQILSESLLKSMFSICITSFYLHFGSHITKCANSKDYIKLSFFANQVSAQQTRCQQTL